ncbi:hypothetical protein D8Y22_14930 [Salinadaptatus halalkaliphilus]|uniref:Rad50/SbcC-type AAA domain-containing protein n=1 Tax=Salinadaptatus halalkaliphilus TaxID=2419781 RepID=A0A4S3TJ63_9EURY|nr:archaea-specific SMC-related protein [Salinadaptatus halalkaliphilus]THE64016.1 hypothetical protein D8Y22_14930 [Salinadaptatus halalkaliphilus]
MEEGPLELKLENVGGIEEQSLTITEETTFIQGPNAANKSSFLKGLLFVLGARSVPIRSGSTDARVVLSTDDRRIERTAHRRNGTIELSDDAWIDDADAVVLLERFAALLETNPLRTAVGRNDSVESLLKEPMNIEQLEARRSEKMQRKRELAAELESTDDVDERLAARERDLEAKRERVDSLETRLEELYDEQDETISTEDDELEALRERRAELRSDETEQTSQIEQLESSIERLESQLAATTESLEDARDAVDGTDIDELKRERERRRADLEDVTKRLEVLQTVLTANREMRDSEHTGALGYDSGLVGDELTCWACGGEASIEDIDETIDELADLVADDKRRKREHEPEIEALTDRIDEIESTTAEIKQLEADKQEIKQTLSNRQDSLTEHRSRLQAVRDEIDDLDEEITAVESDQATDHADLADEIEETRVELQTVRREIERLEDTCKSLRETRTEREETKAEIEALSAEIQTLTDRIENLENELRTVFNDAMDDLLEVLEFERIERVWLDGEFELVIARQIDGQTRTEHLDHLAESEREMIGLVLALAGYITYDVSDVTPVLVLDSLGAFDSERTRRLVDYFADETEYLVATAHPEADVDSEFETVAFESSTTE